MTSLPDGLRLYAIGDVHGCHDALMELLDIIYADHGRAQAVPAAKLIFLGDYVDRGPQTRDVLELLSGGLRGSFGAEFLMGNHERMMLDALGGDDQKMLAWMFNGGSAVLSSYGLARSDHIDDLAAAMPQAHGAFLARLKLTVSYGDYLFVHAGVRPTRALETQDPNDLIWIREPFLSHQGPLGKFIVHGHTPQPEPVIRANRIGIDTGPFFGGPLTALVLEGTTRAILQTGTDGRRQPVYM
mgnify:CR=1 FL=1